MASSDSSPAPDVAFCGAAPRRDERVTPAAAAAKVMNARLDHMLIGEIPAS
jgi:hypothetical protein